MLHCELLYSYTLLYFTLLWIDMTRCDLFTVCLFPWASTPLKYWGVAGRAPKTRQSRRRRRRGGWALGMGCAPSQEIYEFFISKWRDMVQSGCVVFKIHLCPMDCSCMINFIEVPVCSAKGNKIKHLGVKILGVVNTGRPLQVKYWGSRPLRR